jgi:hypothetical protein
MTKSTPWTPEDDALLMKLYPTHRRADIARTLGRTLEAVQSRARKIGLNKPGRKVSTRSFEAARTSRVTVLPSPGYGWGPRTIHRSGV